MIRLFRWVAASTFTTLTGLATLSAFFLLGYNVTLALSTSYDVVNAPQMFLQDSITPTQTTGIRIASPKLNGEDWRFATTTGGVLRIRSFLGSKYEDIAFTGATINSSTNVVTLFGVTRNLCPQSTKTYTSCGDGFQWGRSSVVELNVDARVINLKVNVDRANTGTGLFSIRSNQTTQPWLYPNAVTTAQSDAFTIGKGASDYHIVFDTTLGLMKYWNGSSYVNFGSGSTTNMTTTVKGAGELATVADNSGATITGDSGAPVLVGTNIVIRNSTGAINARNKIVATWNNGYVFPTVLGSGLTGTSSGGYLLTGNNKWSSTGSLGIVSQSILSGALKPVLAQDLVDTSGDVTITSTSFVPVDPLRLSGSVVTAAGDLLMFVVNLEYTSDPSPCTYVTVDITIRDNTGVPASVSQNAVGRGIEKLRCEASQEKTSNFTFWHVAQTGGTLYPGLVARVDGNDVTIRSELSRFQIIRFPQ